MYSSVKKATFLTIISLLLIQCAQVVSPTGGKKDEDPPQLLSSYPENKTVNFKENNISLTFDEYVVVDNLMQKLIITPETDNPYTPLVKNQTVLLKFKRPFEDSTTYTFNFSDGIKDLAERNPAQNLKLVFSTGTSIDSGRVYGTIKDIRTDKPILNALVGLYKLSDTLDPQKIKPYYFSKTDSSGRFMIENTQLNNYALIAIHDKNNNLLYNPKEETIAFLDSVVNVTSDTSNYQLSLFHADITPIRVQRTIPKVNDYTVVFSKGIDSLSLRFEDGQSLPYYKESPTQIKFFNIPIQSDTIKVNILVHDSLGYPLEIDQRIAFLQQRGKERQTSPFTVKSDLETNDEIEPSFQLNLLFNKPVSTFDSTLISVTADSAQITNPENISYLWQNNKTELQLAIKTNAKDSVVVSLPKSSVLSIENDTLAASTYKHKILDPSDYGVLRGTVLNPNGKKFFIELLDKEFKKVVKRADTTPFVFKNVKPDSYRLRLILDENNNGKWDPGDYSRKKQPEKILVFPVELIIKANFEYEEQNFDLSGH
jgi:hypothetical protein